MLSRRRQLDLLRAEAAHHAQSRAATATWRCSTSSASCRCASHAAISMDIGAISAGPNPPHDIHVVIEIPLGGTPVKYELDKKSGALMVDRFLHTAMFYPGKLWLHPANLVGRRRSLRRAGGELGAGGARRCRALPARRRAVNERRGRRRREDHRGAGRRACPVLQGRTQLPRSAADHVRADRSFLPALQGPGKGQMGLRSSSGSTSRLPSNLCSTRSHVPDKANDAPKLDHCRRDHAEADDADGPDHRSADPTGERRRPIRHRRQKKMSAPSSPARWPCRQSARPQPVPASI